MVLVRHCEAGLKVKPVVFFFLGHVSHNGTSTDNNTNSHKVAFRPEETKSFIVILKLGGAEIGWQLFLIGISHKRFLLYSCNNNIFCITGKGIQTELKKEENDNRIKFSYPRHCLCFVIKKKEIACIGENVHRCKETPTESWCFLTTMFPETLANPSFLDLQAITSDIVEILLPLSDHFIASQKPLIGLQSVATPLSTSKNY